MKLQAGVRYVLNDGRETGKLEEHSIAGVFEGSIFDPELGPPRQAYWYSDGVHCGLSVSAPRSISHPVPSRFSRRRSQL